MPKPKSYLKVPISQGLQNGPEYPPKHFVFNDVPDYPSPTRCGIPCCRLDKTKVLLVGIIMTGTGGIVELVVFVC